MCVCVSLWSKSFDFVCRVCPVCMFLCRLSVWTGVIEVSLCTFECLCMNVSEVPVCRICLCGCLHQGSVCVCVCLSVCLCVGV